MILLLDLTQGKASHKLLEELIFASMKVECFRIIDSYVAPANNMTIETILSTIRLDSTYLTITFINTPGVGYTPYYEFYLHNGHYAIKCNMSGYRADEFLRKYKIVLTN
jgi:hypothetical protein